MNRRPFRGISFPFCRSTTARLRYSKNDVGDETYPRMNNGSEYYLYEGSKPLFARNRYGFRRYARDGERHETYPSEGKLRDRLIYSETTSTPLYVTDEWGSERYPVSNGREMLCFSTRDDAACVARHASGKEIYPRDPCGNEYFPRSKRTGDGRPFYLTDEFDLLYVPRTASGRALYLRPEDFQRRLFRNEEEDDYDYDEENVRPAKRMKHRVLYEFYDVGGTRVYTRDARMNVRPTEGRPFKNLAVDFMKAGSDLLISMF